MDIIKYIKKYGNKKALYKPFNNAISYPLHSQDFIRTGFMNISPTLASRDYKDPKCIMEVKKIKIKAISTNGKKIKIASTILSGYHKSNMMGFNADNGVLEKVKIRQATDKGFIECKLGGVADLSYPSSKTRRGRVQNNGNISPTLTVAGINGLHKVESLYRIRKLTPLECWRLMGFTDDEFKKAEKVNSNTQLYKQAGNSIVVDVLQNIFKEIFEPTEKQIKGQLSIYDLIDLI